MTRRARLPEQCEGARPELERSSDERDYSGLSQSHAHAHSHSYHHVPPHTRDHSSHPAAPSFPPRRCPHAPPRKSTSSKCPSLPSHRASRTVLSPTPPQPASLPGPSPKDASVKKTASVKGKRGAHSRQSSVASLAREDTLVDASPTKPKSQSMKPRSQIQCARPHFSPPHVPASSPCHSFPIALVTCHLSPAALRPPCGFAFVMRDI